MTGKGETGPKTAVIYARFSCSKQREASIDDQLRVCNDYCQREGIEVVGVYADYAMSGRTDDRPQFQKMIANAPESDYVVVYMMERFSRAKYDPAIYKKQLEQKGVQVKSALEYIPEGPEGILMEKILEGQAAYFSLDVSRKTRRGMEGNALQCKTNGVRCYGYRRDENDRYEIVPEEAEVVREVFRRRIAGEALNHIASDLAERGVRTYTGKPCTYGMVHNMVHNEKYLGIYEWGGIRQEDGMPRIIDDDTFYRAQHVKGKKQRKNEHWGDFALSGRVLCSECGRNMPGVSGRGWKDVKYEYYKCTNCKGVKPVRRDWLETETVKALREMLESREKAVEIAHLLLNGQNDAEVDAERRRAIRAMNEADKALSNILKAIEQGIIPPGTRERIDQLEVQKRRAEHDLKTLEAKQIDPESFADFLQFGATLSDADLLDAFVYQVMVFDGQCVITLNYETEKCEPARLILSRVRTESTWCPVCKNTRTMMTVVNGAVYLRFSRAA